MSPAALATPSPHAVAARSRGRRSLSSRTVERGVVSEHGPGADEHDVASARRRGCRARAAAPLIQRLVPSDAARSAVESRGELPGDERPTDAPSRRSTRGSAPPPPRRVRRARRRRRPRAATAAPPAATGLGRPGRTRRGDAGVDQRPVQGPVRPLWLHGSRVTTAVAPTRPAAGARRGRRPRRAASRRPGGSPRAMTPAVRVEDHAARPAGWGRAATRGSAASVERAAHRRDLCRRLPSRPPLVRSPGPAGSRGATATATPACAARGAPRGDARGCACILPSGLSPSVPEFHRVNRPLAADSGRGLSPPVRSFTDPGAREFSLVAAPFCHAAADPTAPGSCGRGSRAAAVRAQLLDHRVRVVGAEDRRAGDEHVGAGLGAPLDRLGARLPRRPGATCRRRARSISSRARRILGRHTSRNSWPPKPGSTVITSTMSSSGSRSAYGSIGGRGLERHPGPGAHRAQLAGQPHRAPRPPRRGTSRCDAPASTYAGRPAVRVLDHQVAVERHAARLARALRRPAGRASGWARSGCPSRRRAASRRRRRAAASLRGWRSRRPGCSARSGCAIGAGV